MLINPVDGWNSNTSRLYLSSGKDMFKHCHQCNHVFILPREPAYITADRLSQLLSAMINRLLNRFVLSSTKLPHRFDNYCQLAKKFRRVECKCRLYSVLALSDWLIGRFFLTLCLQEAKTHILCRHIQAFTTELLKRNLAISSNHRQPTLDACIPWMQADLRNGPVIGLARASRWFGK